MESLLIKAVALLGLNHAMIKDLVKTKVSSPTISETTIHRETEEFLLNVKIPTIIPFTDEEIERKIKVEKQLNDST